jgi:hypothetical protein
MKPSWFAGARTGARTSAHLADDFASAPDFRGGLLWNGSVSSGGDYHSGVVAAMPPAMSYDQAADAAAIV